MKFYISTYEAFFQKKIMKQWQLRQNAKVKITTEQNNQVINSHVKSSAIARVCYKDFVSHWVEGLARQNDHERNFLINSNGNAIVESVGECQGDEAIPESVLFSHGDGLARLRLPNHHTCGNSLCIILSSDLPAAIIQTNKNKQMENFKQKPLNLLFLKLYHTWSPRFQASTMDGFF